MPRITACVITKNEEKTLTRALRSLRFADEIVVVDAGSTDQTLEIAKNSNAKIYQNPWNGFTEQRNFALSKCSGDWVFFLDSDEAATEQLGALLKRISEDDLVKHPNCYSIRREEYFLGKLLVAGPGNPSFQWRFFKKNAVHFEGEVHEFPRFEGGIGMIGKSQSTKEAFIHHWPSLGVDRFLNKLNHYTTLEALDRFSQGIRTSLFHATFTFFSTFLKNGIRYGGFRNGKEGFVLTLLESFSRVVRHLKLWVFWQVYEGKIKIDLNVKLPVPGSAKPYLHEELEKAEVPSSININKDSAS